MQIKPEHFSKLPRYATLSKLRAYYQSTQYDGKADFFTGKRGNSGEVVPLRERKPCVIYPLPKNAVTQVSRFTFGESRYPSVTVDEVTAENAVAGESLSKDDAKEAETFVSALTERCGVRALAMRAMRQGTATGTAVLIYSLDDGLIRTRIANAEDMLVEWRGGRVGGDVTYAVWCYQYTETVANSRGEPEQQRFWFRQDFTGAEFIEFERVKFEPNAPVVWTESRRVSHGFGFCPVRWIRNVPECDTADLDGVSLYGEQLDEFDALNFSLSQRHRGINYWGVPQPWETGVDDNDGPGATGRTATPGYSPSDKAPHGSVAQPEKAVKVSPDNKWSFRSEKAKLGLLETTGKAFEAASLHVNDIRGRMLESMSVVLVSIADVAGRTQQNEMSAKFLELAYEPLLALVDEMRLIWWPQGLKLILSDMLRIVVAKKGEGIWIPGAKSAAAILVTFSVTVADDTGAQSATWICPPLTPVWGDFFSAGLDEVKAAVEVATAADGLVPDEDRQKYVLPYFGRTDMTDAIAEVDAENEEKAAEEAKEAEKLAEQVAATQPTKAPVVPKKAKGKPA